jgi:hypothetical protein
MKKSIIENLYTLYTYDCEDICDRIGDYIGSLERISISNDYNYSSFSNVMYTINDSQADIKQFLQTSVYLLSIVKKKVYRTYIKKMIKDVSYLQAQLNVHLKYIKRTYKVK